MNKRHALIISLLLTLLIANVTFIFTIISSASNYESVIVARVIDGDTIDLKDGRRIRLLNINAPETNMPHNQLSTNYLKQFKNQTIQIQTTGSGRYSRTLARIFTPDYLNLYLVEQGLASKAWVEESELSEFAKAEESAIKNQKGMWKHSIYYGCFTSQINKKDEFVVLTNKCNSINLENWIIKDESAKYLKLPSISEKSITIYTAPIKTNSTAISWNSNQNIWNNDRDSLYLFDKDGNIVHYNSYGY